MYLAEYYPEKIEIYRGTDHILYFEMINNVTKVPMNYVGSTFSAILIDQQDQDYEILATYSNGLLTSLTNTTATLEFKLSATFTASISNNQAYLRIYHTTPQNEKNLFIYGNVEIRV